MSSDKFEGVSVGDYIEITIAKKSFVVMYKAQTRKQLNIDLSLHKTFATSLELDSN